MDPDLGNKPIVQHSKLFKRTQSLQLSKFRTPKVTSEVIHTFRTIKNSSNFSKFILDISDSLEERISSEIYGH